MEKNKFPTQRGATLELRPIAYYTLRDMEKMLNRPTPPVYTFEGAGGAKAIRRHNETTLQTEDDLLAWEKYQTDLSEFHHRHACMTLGLGVVDAFDITPEWLDDCKSLGGTPPKDARELKGFYILREICPTPTEYNALINAIMELSGLIVGNEVADKVNSFPDNA